MQNRRIVLAVVAVLALGVAWYLFRPERLWINKSVSEGLPAVEASMRPESAEPKLLASGDFHDGSHETSGKAAIYQLEDGSRVLRLTDFHTSNGPDVQVYLVAADDATDNETVTKAGFVHVGALKGNIGDQNYVLPADVDLSKHRAVTVWCRRFGVNFGTAPLMTTGGSAMHEAMPAGAPSLIVSGAFHPVAHEGKGTAGIYRLADGRRILRFTDFETSNGPDVQVYLVAAGDASDNATVTDAGFIHLGGLKGNLGDQNYDVPADVDLDRYRAVTIWCRRFGVNFATAPLAPAHS